MSRIVVIGAGVGGLACALRLGAAGHQVSIVEQSDVAGGALGRLVRDTPHGVFRFDTGPSLLTLPQVFADLFAATGSTLERELDLVPLDPVVRHIFADGATLDSCADQDELVRRVAVLSGPADAAGWRRLWRRAARVWDASWRHVLRAPAPTPAALARLAWRLPDLAAVAPGRSLRGLTRHYLADPRLWTLLDRYATYTGSDPRRAPAALVAIPYAELTFGGWYLRGGLGTLADALARRCAAVGVTIHAGTPVRAVQTARGRVAGVRLADGTVVAADVVVANVDAATVYSDLAPHPRRAYQSRRRSLSGFVLLLAVRGRTEGLAQHTVFFPANYDAEFDAVFGQPARPVPDPTIFVTVADDPALRPPGHEAWFVLVNAAPQGSGPDRVDWLASGLAEEYADRVLATLAARGVDVRGRVLARDLLTPADLAQRTGSPDGAIYGTPSHGIRGLIRPSNRSHLPGLYLVGGSVHPGGGLPMVALSAEIVAARIGPA